MTRLYLSARIPIKGEEETDGDEEDEEYGKDSVDDGEGGGKVVPGNCAASRIIESPLSPLVSLVELNLSDNGFASVASLAPLTLLPSLRDVDLRENDVRVCENAQTSKHACFFNFFQGPSCEATAINCQIYCLGVRQVH